MHAKHSKGLYHCKSSFSHSEQGGIVPFPYLDNSKLGNCPHRVPIGNIPRPGMSSEKAEPNSARKRGETQWEERDGKGTGEEETT